MSIKIIVILSVFIFGLTSAKPGAPGATYLNYGFSAGGYGHGHGAYGHGGGYGHGHGDGYGHVKVHQTPYAHDYSVQLKGHGHNSYVHQGGNTHHGYAGAYGHGY